MTQIQIDIPDSYLLVRWRNKAVNVVHGQHVLIDLPGERTGPLSKIHIMDGNRRLLYAHRVVPEARFIAECELEPSELCAQCLCSVLKHQLPTFASHDRC